MRASLQGSKARPDGQLRQAAGGAGLWRDAVECARQSGWRRNQTLVELDVMAYFEVLPLAVAPESYVTYVTG